MIKWLLGTFARMSNGIVQMYRVNTDSIAPTIVFGLGGR